MHRTLAVAIVVVAMAAGLCGTVIPFVGPATAHAGAPEPKGRHPRILLDDHLRATWKRQADQRGSAVSRAIGRCNELRQSPKQFARDLYMGLDWAQYIQACLVAWAATGKDDHAKVVMTYFKAMLDDLDN